MNYLFCSVGRRGELLKDFKRSLPQGSLLVALDSSPYAPALYLADKQYVVPRIDDPRYIEMILDICVREKINVVATFIDPEIEVLAKNRHRFEEIGVLILCPSLETAELCFDKYKMFQFLRDNKINTVMTWGTLDAFVNDFENGHIQFPVFVKPRTGSGSVGAHRVNDIQQLSKEMNADPSLIIQELMIGVDLDADVYIDTITHTAVSAFSKRKIETRIGGANKTVSFKDPELFEFVKKIVSVFEFNGPVDMDFFYRDGQYYLSEINPRFGGAYLHAYGAGVDFIKLIENNLHGKVNVPSFGDYEDGVVMMMFDSVIICTEKELAQNFR